MSRPRKYPFHDLQPGQSVVVPRDKPEGFERWNSFHKADHLKQHYTRIANAAYEYGRKVGRRYSVRQHSDGVLVQCRELVAA